MDRSLGSVYGGSVTRFLGGSMRGRRIRTASSADLVFASNLRDCAVFKFRRSDDSLVTRFGSQGRGDGELSSPHAMCFMSRETRVAVADTDNNRVSVFTIDGAFVRHVGVGVVKEPVGVACSACDELVITDTGNKRVLVLNDVGEVWLTFGSCEFSSVAVHGDAVFAQERSLERCFMWSASIPPLRASCGVDAPTLREINGRSVWYRDCDSDG
jgi:hypothetical protein